METCNFSSTSMETSSSGSLRTMSKNRRVGMTHIPASVTAAPTFTVMPVSRLKPVSWIPTPARRRMPSRQGIVLFAETVLDATEIAETSSAFSQVNFIFYSLTFFLSFVERIGFIF